MHSVYGMVGKRIGQSICLYEFDDVRYGYDIFQNGVCSVSNKYPELIRW